MSWLLAVLAAAAGGGLVALFEKFRRTQNERDEYREQRDQLAADRARRDDERKKLAEIEASKRAGIATAATRTRNELVRAAEEPEASEREIWKETGQ